MLLCREPSQTIGTDGPISAIINLPAENRAGSGLTNHDPQARDFWNRLRPNKIIGHPQISSYLREGTGSYARTLLNHCQLEDVLNMMRAAFRLVANF